MGDRHNRKRTRHRPIRRQRLCPQFDQCEAAVMIPSTSTSEQHPTQLQCSCWHPSARQIPTTTTTSNPNMRLQPLQTSHGVPIINNIPETPRSRTRRVFGGVDSSDDEDGDIDVESTELCGPMLDVVLGLFGGVDYDYDDEYHGNFR
jgi:hypothetical protein